MIKLYTQDNKKKKYELRIINIKGSNEQSNLFKKVKSIIAKGIKRAIIKNTLEDNYFGYNKNSGLYEYECYADYNDYLSDDTIKEILDSDVPMDAFYDIVRYWYEDSDYETPRVIQEVNDKLQCVEIFDLDIDEDDIRDEIYEISTIRPPYSYILNQSVKVNLILDCGDEDYDFSCNNFYDKYYFNDDNLECRENSSLLWLINQQGYNEKQIRKIISQEEYTTESKFLKSIDREVLNACTSINALTFLAEMSLEELININEKIKNKENHKLMISKNAMCGLVDFWGGSGSVIEIELEKDVEITLDMISSLTIDGGIGYGINGIYGLISECWKNNCIKIAL